MKTLWGEGAEEYCWAITGAGAVMLRPIRFQCDGFWISPGPPCTITVDHVYNQFRLTQNSHSARSCVSTQPVLNIVEGDTSVSGFWFAGRLWNKLYLKVLRFFRWHPRKYSTVTSSINQSTNRSDDQNSGQLHHNERLVWQFLFMARQPLGGQGLSTAKTSRSHSHAPHSVGFPSRSGQPDSETTHNTHKRQTSTPRLGFEPTIPASQRPQTQGLEAMGTGMGPVRQYNNKSQSDNRLTFAHKSLTQVLLTLVPLTQVITALCPHHFH